MNVLEVEEIRTKLTEVKDKSTKAQGAIDQLLVQIKKEHEIDTLEEAETLNETLTEGIEADVTRRQELLDKLDKVTDWSKL